MFCYETNRAAPPPLGKKLAPVPCGMQDLLLFLNLLVLELVVCAVS